MNMMFFSAIGFNLFDDFFHILYIIFIGNQYRIFGLHNNQVFYTDGGHKTRFRIDIAVAGVMTNDITMINISFFSMFTDIP